MDWAKKQEVRAQTILLTWDSRNDSSKDKSENSGQQEQKRG